MPLTIDDLKALKKGSKIQVLYKDNFEVNLEVLHATKNGLSFKYKIEDAIGYYFHDFSKTQNLKDYKFWKIEK